MKAMGSSKRWMAMVALSAVLAGVTSCSSSTPGAAATATVTAPANSSVINFGTTAQTIRGFGGSTAFLSPINTQDASELFGVTSNVEIGLSLLRVRIDPTGQVNWGSELGNAQQAVLRGANVFATPWTPPAAMKSNNNIVGGSLNTASYGAYAAYLESYVNYMSANGVNLYAISMQNEPDAVVNYESCGWTPAQMATWVQNNAGVLTTKLIMPESESFHTNYSDPTLNNATAAANVAIVGGHLYGATPTVYTNAMSKGKDVWMTEHYIAGGPTLTNAMTMAKEISDSISVGQYNAYVWWYVKDDLIGLLNNSDQVTLFGYTMEQWSKFVRPGYQAVSTTYNPVAGVYVTAFAGNGHEVIVAINNGTSAVTQGFQTSGATLTQVTPYQTSATENFAQLTPIGVSGGVFTASLPAQSVTTFYQ
jgi:glucuronoarabinoxylan endo-1,4-beta-xylanase